jgi:protein translocase SecG subunit
METLLWIVQILVCVLIIIAVLIQGGENVDITAAFGGVSQAAFGPRGAVSTLAKNHLGAVRHICGDLNRSLHYSQQAFFWKSSR